MFRFFSITEDWSLLHALYFSVVTCATIGYGDYTPKGGVARLFSIPFVLVGSASTYAALALIADVLADGQRKRIAYRILNKKLDKTSMRAITRTSNRMNEQEFVEYILLQMAIIDYEQLQLIKQRYRELDNTDQGFPDLTDGPPPPVSIEDIQSLNEGEGRADRLSEEYLKI